MTHFDYTLNAFVGEHGTFPLHKDDEITRKIAMLIEGECNAKNISETAQKFGFSRQRYYQVRDAFLKGGAAMLESKQRGPKTNYRATDEVVRQVVRYRFLDHDASAQVIAQRLNQNGWKVSKRTVERVIQQYGLQKKLHDFQPDAPNP